MRRVTAVPIALIPDPLLRNRQTIAGRVALLCAVAGMAVALAYVLLPFTSPSPNGGDCGSAMSVRLKDDPGPEFQNVMREIGGIINGDVEDVGQGEGLGTRAEELGEDLFCRGESSRRLKRAGIGAGVVGLVALVGAVLFMRREVGPPGNSNIEMPAHD